MKKMRPKSNIVGLKELRNNIEVYIQRVQKGESFTVVRRSEPVFKVSSPDEDESLWETVIDFTKINPNGVPASEVLKALKSLNSQI